MSSTCIFYRFVSHIQLSFSIITLRLRLAALMICFFRIQLYLTSLPIVSFVSSLIFIDYSAISKRYKKSRSSYFLKNLLNFATLPLSHRSAAIARATTIGISQPTRVIRDSLFNDFALYLHFHLNSGR